MPTDNTPHDQANSGTPDCVSRADFDLLQQRLGKVVNDVESFMSHFRQGRDDILECITTLQVNMAEGLNKIEARKADKAEVEEIRIAKANQSDLEQARTGVDEIRTAKANQGDLEQVRAKLEQTSATVTQLAGMLMPDGTASHPPPSLNDKVGPRH